MSRFYRIKNNKATFVKSVTTPVQARKAEGHVVASVTTKLKILPNPFMENWRLNQMYDLCQQYPNKSFEELKPKLWGERKLPTGEVVTSSEFGLEFHKQIEFVLRSYFNIKDLKCSVIKGMGQST